MLVESAHKHAQKPPITTITPTRNCKAKKHTTRNKISTTSIKVYRNQSFFTFFHNANVAQLLAVTVDSAHPKKRSSDFFIFAGSQTIHCTALAKLTNLKTTAHAYYLKTLQQQPKSS
jgi:Holliday junction resolvasome RuvABC ATP-dependent DNA helicase subunit